MLFPEEDAPMLKAWVVKRLETSSDADADVLADYVLALLRHDGSVEDVRKLCEAEVPDFVNEDSDAFIRDVFNVIQYRTYLPGGASMMPNPAALPQGLPYDDVPMNLEPQPFGPAQNGSRKRPYNERGDVDMQDGGEYSANGYKQPRRGRGGRSDYTAGFGRGAATGGFPGVGGYQPQPQQPQFGLPPSGSAPAFDPASMESFMKMQSFMPLPMPGFPPQGQQGFSGPPIRRQLCRDYETKGYCARGNSCRFDHPTDSIFVPPTAPQTSEEYDPTNASMVMGAMDLPSPARANQPFNMRGRNPRSPQDKRQTGRRRAPFSAEGPVNDKTKMTIVVEAIPEEHFTEEAVRGFFSQFGNIVEVSMQPYKHLAIVKYDSWDAANAAYRSPKVIFENRFVKVFWYKEGDPSIVPPTGAAQGSHNGSRAAREGSQSVANGGGGEEIDMDEFLRKQDEAQKAFLEKQQKAQELERQREEIERKRKELAAKQQEERQKLIAAMSKKGGSPATGAEDSGKPSSKPTNQTEALRAQLAALEAEAKQLGIDPDAAMAEDDGSGWSSGYRGGRGRGRGGFVPRGRGGYVPRGSFRGGGFRGGRGGGPAAYAAYSLDNRPKKVAITGVDFTDPSNGEPLRRHLFGIGEFTNIEETPTAATITFKDRKTAETFFRGLPNKQIPGIEGHVELSWVNNDGTISTPAPSSNGAGAGAEKVAAKPTVAGGAPADTQTRQKALARGDDTTMADGVHHSSAQSINSDTDVHIVTESKRDDSRMDYDVADDDNQWND